MKQMKHVQIINRKTIRLLLLIFVLTFCMAPVSSYADGPVDGPGGSEHL